MDNLSKAQEIAVILPEDAGVIDTVTDPDEIADFISALDMEGWTLAELPEDAREVGAFGMAQEKTVRLGQTEADGTLYDIGTITLYGGAYVELTIGDLNMTFAVGEETADYLSGYFASNSGDT